MILDALQEAKQRERLLLDSFVPVSLVAKDWKITPRRVRVLLAAGRLAGRQLENGYWEVAYPYTMTEGRRGPCLRKYGQKSPERRTE